MPELFRIFGADSHARVRDDAKRMLQKVIDDIRAGAATRTRARELIART